MALFLLFGLLFLLLFAGAPVAVALGVSSLVFIIIDGLPSVVVLHNMVNGINSFPLIAVPFFIMAGHLMNTAGITTKIFAFARATVGWMYGGLGHVNVGASVIFAGMSGAAVADAGGLGNIEIKAMRDAGYDTDFSVGITAASSTIGPIIPPSLPLVVYGVIANTSIGQLFAAGLIPGMLMAFSLMVMVAFYAKIRNYPRDDRFSPKLFLHTLWHAILPLFTPLIIVGGILTGIFTPTEAAIAAVAYSLFLGVVVYRTLDLRRILRVSIDTVDTTASIMMIVAASAIFAWILTANQVAEMFAGELLGFTDNRVAILLIIMLIYHADCTDCWLFHGNSGRDHHFNPGSAPGCGANWRRSGAFWYYPYSQFDDRSADTAGWSGSLCVVQSIGCSFRTMCNRDRTFPGPACSCSFSTYLRSATVHVVADDALSMIGGQEPALV